MPFTFPRQKKRDLGAERTEIASVKIADKWTQDLIAKHSDIETAEDLQTQKPDRHIQLAYIRRAYPLTQPKSSRRAREKATPVYKKGAMLIGAMLFVHHLIGKGEYGISFFNPMSYGNAVSDPNNSLLYQNISQMPMLHGDSEANSIFNDINAQVFALKAFLEGYIARYKNSQGLDNVADPFGIKNFNRAAFEKQINAIKIDGHALSEYEDISESAWEHMLDCHQAPELRLKADIEREKQAQIERERQELERQKQADQSQKPAKSSWSVGSFVGSFFGGRGQPTADMPKDEQVQQIKPS